MFSVVANGRDREKYVDLIFPVCTVCLYVWAVSLHFTTGAQVEFNLIPTVIRETFGNMSCAAK